MTYCADDEDFYKEIIKEYATTSPDRIKELEDAFAVMDLDTYAIKVHALKSVAKTVGDKQIFERAYELEMASKGKKADIVKEKHSDLIENYKKMAQLINKVL